MAVRHERVVLSLQDDFSTSMARAAAATALLDRQLDELGRASTNTHPPLARMSRDVDHVGGSSRSAGRELDSFTGRLGLLATTVGAFGPAAVPVLAGATAGAVALVGQLSAVGLAGGVVVTAFHDVGTALEAVNKAQIEPTAENLRAANEAMSRLPLSAQAAVQAMQRMRPVLGQIQAAAADGFFPGYIDGLESLQTLAPEVETIFHRVAAAAGDLVRESGESLASDRWRPFFDFVADEAAPTLTQFGHTVGNLTHGVAEMVMAFGPLSNDIGDGLLSMSESFDHWASGLAGSKDFQEFLDYVRTTGPQVMETVGSIADALLQIAEAAAPLGGPVLQGIEAFADIVALIADSPIGPAIMAAVTAMSALSLASRVFGATAGMSFAQATASARAYAAALRGINADPLITGLGRAQALSKGAKVAGVGAAGVAALGAAATASAHGISMQNTAMLAGIGLMAGPWGAAAGAAVGATIDLTKWVDRNKMSIEDWRVELQAASGDTEKLAALRERLNKFREHTTVGEDKDAAKALKELSKAEAEASEAAETTARAQGFASSETMKRVDALKALHDATVGSLSAELGWEQAMLDSAKVVAENGRVLTANGEALKGHEQAAIDSQRGVVGLIAAWNEQVRAGDATTTQMDATKAAVRRMAGEMGLGRTETRKLIQAMDDIEPLVKTKVEVATEQAMRELNQFKAFYDSIRSKTVTITTNTGKHGGGAGDLLLGPLGGSAPKQQRAQGGPIYGPGTATSDSIPAMLSNGEYVIRAAAVAHYGVDFFDRANQTRLARGGRAGKGTSSPVSAEAYGIAGEFAQIIKASFPLKQQLDLFGQSLDAAQSSLDKETAARDQLQQSISDGLKGDLFSKVGRSPWGQQYAAGSIGDVNARLTSQINDANQMTSLQQSLANRGLSGGALQSLIVDGGLTGLKSFSAASDAQLAQYQALYSQRDTAVNTAAVTGGNVTGMTAAVDRTTSEVAALNAAVTAIQKQMDRHHKDRKRNSAGNAARVGDAVAAANDQTARRAARRRRHR